VLENRQTKKTVLKSQQIGTWQSPSARGVRNLFLKASIKRRKEFVFKKPAYRDLVVSCARGVKGH
jgi:hypothetical protein